MGDYKAEAGRRNFFLTVQFFCTATSRLVCRGPSNAHFGSEFSGGAPSGQESSPPHRCCSYNSAAELPLAVDSVFLWQPCPFSRGLNLSLVGTSSKFLGSSVMCFPSALEVVVFCVAISAHLRVSFYHFRSYPPFT